MRTKVAFYDAFALFEGSGRAMMDLISLLDEGRFDPVVVCPRDGELIRAATARGYSAAIVEPSGPLRRYNKALLSGGPLAAPGIAVALLRYGLRLARWLRAHDVDVLHCNQTRAALQAGLGGRLARTPVVWVSRIRDDLPAIATRFGARCAEAVVSLAPVCLGGFRGAEALDGKVVEIPLGVDTDRFAPGDSRAIPAGLGVDPDRPIVVMVGGLHPRKRHDLLLRAAPAVLEQVPEAQILIVGGSFEDTGDDYQTTLRHLHQNLALGDRVVLAGRRDDVPAILRACDVFVLPSDQEGLPGSVIEAMATGLPCVVTPVAGAPIEDGASGLIVEPDSPEALAEAIVRLLTDRDLSQRLAQAARAVAVERYSLEATVAQYERLYERLAAGQPHSLDGPAERRVAIPPPAGR